MKDIFAVESPEEFVSLQCFADSVKERLQAYIDHLKTNYAVRVLPKAIVWTTREIATEQVSDLPIPAYTNEHRIMFAPDITAWREIYLSQINGLSGPEADTVRTFYTTKLGENHILQILGHELAHHSDYFPDSDYETNIWFEEGMVEYISRKYFLTAAEFEELATVNRLLVNLLEPRYGNHPLEDFGAETYAGDYGSFFYEYWRSFLAVQEIVDHCNGDAVLAMRRGVQNRDFS